MNGRINRETGRQTERSGGFNPSQCRYLVGDRFTTDASSYDEVKKTKSLRIHGCLGD